MMIFLSFWDGVGEAIIDALRSLMLSLCEIICRLIVFFFDIFMMLGNASILNNSTVQEIYQRVGLILGLFMIFRVTFSLIQYVINPDLMVDKQKGLFNIVKKIIIVIVLLGTTPSLFRLAYDVQRMVINSNIIPKIITGQTADSGDFGKDLAWYTFSSFYSFDNTFANSTEKSKCPELESGVIENTFKNSNKLNYAYNCVNEKITYTNQYDETAKYYLIDFDGHGLLSVIVGGVILWMIVMYAVQVGIRVVQLAYLQLIAPAPIIMYLAPKGDDTLNKWVKQCTTTYLDFFIRVAIIYFVIFIIQMLIGTDSSYFVSTLGDASDTDLTWIKIIMVLALLVFAKKVPDLFKELFPSAGGAAKFDFGLSPKKVFNDTLAASLIGGTVGALGAGASNTIHGFMNMRRAWSANTVDRKLTAEEKANLIKNKGEEEGQKAIDEYNKRRSAQLWARSRAVASAGAKTVASVAGGVIGGGVAGLKTKDITKSGEAIKTANTNRENRELREEAGYHWYNPLPSMGDKILEFSGDRSADDMKKRRQAMVDERERKQYINEGKDLYERFSIEKDDGSGELTLDYEAAFAHQEYKNSYANVKKAKKNVGIAEAAIESEQANLSAAYNSGDERKIAIAEGRMKAAKDNLKAYTTILEEAQKEHDRVKIFYEDDAKVEAKYKYYADNYATKIVNVKEEGLKAGINFDNEVAAGGNNSPQNQVDLNTVINGEPSNPSGPVDINAIINDELNQGGKPINLSSGELASIKAKLNDDLKAQEAAYDAAMRAQRDAMAKQPFSQEAIDAQVKARAEEDKRDSIAENIANLDQLISRVPNVNNVPKKLTDKERKALEKAKQKAEAEGNANEAARIEKILSENRRLYGE